ncbi:O-antigen ligase family protein [Winogradskyella bathintestinalis]|uniref:O-antigen ligase family protein n=1 Tax=Winogradskyella bathintestinalis TaxID=3035208 RepID=A0ABT7ZS71_9FLAO|nr:O-antigen ligase family protein [Winogradskyella bathintestinalis]MDN3491588.1 O-antigen ligase family protein [Winogradskyella bathintestinalis]
MTLNKYLHQTYNLFFCVLCFTLPFEKVLSAAPNVMLITLILLSVFIIKRNAFKAFMQKEKSYAVFAIFFGVILLFSIINGEIENDLFFFQKLAIPLILIPLSIPLKTTIHLKITFIIAVLLAILISIYNIVLYINNIGEFSFSQGNIINDILIAERLYIGFTCVISLVLSLQLYNHNTLNLKKAVRLLFLINALIILIFLLFIAARIAIISAVLVCIYFIITKLKSNYKYIIVFGTIVITGLLFLANPNLSKRFFHIHHKYSDSFFEKIKKHEPRYEIWNCSLGFIDYNKELLIGNGYNKTKDLLVNCYSNNIEDTERKEWFIKSRFNTHNQFFDILLSSGSIALLLFLLYLYHLIKIGRVSFLGIGLLVVLILIMLVENILHRQVGCYLFAFITILILKNKRERILKFKETKD